MAKRAPTPESVAPTRVQRILTSMIVGVIGTAIVSIIIDIASAAFKWNLFWFFGPLASIGMLLGMLLMFVLMMVSIRIKARQNSSNE
jgi:hypothetical protein